MNKELLKQIQSACIKEGDEPGFQFFIKCPSCKYEIYTDFVPYTGSALVKSFLKKSSEVNEDWVNQQRECFQNAVAYFEDIMVYCEHCDKYVCQDCFVIERGMCMVCCTESAKRVLDESWHQIHSNQESQHACHKCGAKIGKAKFCPKCGAKQKVKGICEFCSARIPEDAIFCPECGKKVA